MEKRIDVMIIGAQKAGTTSLLKYLGEHPQCISHPQKEFSYFTDNNEFNEGLDRAFSKYYYDQKGIKNPKIISKNAGLYTREECLKRLKDNNPKVEIIYILRNPVERTYSSYLMEKNAGALKFDFLDLPKLINKHKENYELWGYSFFIDYSLYAQHLKTIYKYFPKEQVTIILYNDFKNEALSICKNIFRKIGVDPDFSPNVNVKHNVTQKTYSLTYARIIRRLLQNKNPIKKFIKKFLSSNKTYKYGEALRQVNKKNERHTEMDEEVRNFLIEFYKPYNKELEVLIGKDLSDWNK